MPDATDTQRWPEVKLMRAPKGTRLRFAPSTPAPGYERDRGFETETYVPTVLLQAERERREEAERRVSELPELRNHVARLQEAYAASERLRAAQASTGCESWDRAEQAEQKQRELGDMLRDARQQRDDNLRAAEQKLEVERERVETIERKVRLEIGALHKQAERFAENRDSCVDGEPARHYYGGLADAYDHSACRLTAAFEEALAALNPSDTQQGETCKRCGGSREMPLPSLGAPRTQRCPYCTEQGENGG